MKTLHNKMDEPREVHGYTTYLLRVVRVMHDNFFVICTQVLIYNVTKQLLFGLKTISENVDTMWTHADTMWTDVDCLQKSM